MNKLTLLVITITAFMLTSCGFKPMHAPNNFGGTSTGFSDISVASLGNEKADFLVKQALRDRLGDNMSARYILEITPKVTRRTLGIGADDVGSRYDLTIGTSFKLLDTKTGKILLSDRVSAISTFAAPRDTYGTVSAQNNATEQVAKETSDRILIRVARFYQTNKSK